MKAYLDLLPFVLPFAPSAPDPLCERYIRQAAIDFCRRTRSWRDVQDIEVTGDESEILMAPPYASIHEIEAAHFKIAGAARWEELRAVPYADLEQSLLDEAPTDKTIPSVFSQSGFDAVTIAPRAAGTLRLIAYLKPTQTAEYGPDYLFDRYSSEIADGALSHILMIPEQPFTNPNLAAFKAGIFNAACDHNFALNVRGQQRAPVRVKSSFM